jgi:hypothetical protein
MKGTQNAQGRRFYRKMRSNLKRFDASMNELVFLMRAQIAKEPAACGAPVRLLPRVRSLMTLQILHVAKVLRANVALKRALARVYSLMAAQRWGEGEDFFALLAREWFFAGVDAEMFDQGAFLEEALAAELALKRRRKMGQQSIILCGKIIFTIQEVDIGICSQFTYGTTSLPYRQTEWTNTRVV